MFHVIIGLIVGIIMGLTGAGGALISIPLFISLLNLTLKEATFLSLIAVMFGTSFNLIGQFKLANKKIVFGFVTFGAISNILSLPLKKVIPELGIAFLLLGIGLYSVWVTWKPINSNEVENVDRSIIKTGLTGAGLGVLTTLTGLGGGVLLIPILKNIFGFKNNIALPTSLLTIYLISLLSFLVQMKSGITLISITEIGYIAIGSIVAYFLLKATLKSLDSKKVEQIRKLAFTLVAIYSVASVLVKTL